MKRAFIIFFLIVAILLIIFPELLIEFLIEKNFPWTIAQYSHYILILILSYIIARQLKLNLNRAVSILIKVAIPLVLLGLYFVRKPIYEGDLSKKGTELSIEKNALLEEIISTQPDFNGVVCIAATWCPYCKTATKERLKVMKNRKPSLDVAVYLVAEDSNDVKNYISETEAPELTYFLMKDTEGVNELTNGAYPTYVYIKNGTIIHKWSNNNLGYPALDWIEKKLN